ncbi:hypothetical protein [Mesorhizobium sp.]|uniref:hypothetical protein n=1 Tax=Mesorhizobium sp. TaxID=1871066 RepID=UPI00120BC640|nr:hypothetical protein [Mesorhizobium sp.]TIQ24985.1 MAG: hypothetical protein E5X54_32165 [Mesorhizobium sp.]
MTFVARQVLNHAHDLPAFCCEVSRLSRERLTNPAEALAFRGTGADELNHSIAPEATSAREIGACFVSCAFVTAELQRLYGPLSPEIAAGGLPNLSMTASRVALETAARLPVNPECSCQERSASS